MLYTIITDSSFDWNENVSGVGSLEHADMSPEEIANYITTNGSIVSNAVFNHKWATTINECLKKHGLVIEGGLSKLQITSPTDVRFSDMVDAIVFCKVGDDGKVKFTKVTSVYGG